MLLDINQKTPSYMHTGTITVVVPSYNAESHLQQCIDSILAQPEVGELIVIDDGSTDSTSALVKEYINMDSRVILFSQNNKGVSAARNNGIIHASKRWLAFVDADDIVPEGAYAALCDSAEHCDADLCYGRYELIDSQNSNITSHEFDGFQPGCISVHKVIENLVCVSSNSLSGSCWRILFRTSFIKDNSIEFPIGIHMSEDYSFILKCFRYNPVISYTNHIVYKLRREGNSVTQRYQPQLARDMDAINEQLSQICTGDKKLEFFYWANVANTAWYVCRNFYKPESPYSKNERLAVIKKTLVHYKKSLKKFSFRCGMPLKKVLLLKLAYFSPYAFWKILESNKK